jgi:hypothetical protein
VLSLSLSSRRSCWKTYPNTNDNEDGGGEKSLSEIFHPRT